MNNRVLHAIGVATLVFPGCHNEVRRETPSADSAGVSAPTGSGSSSDPGAPFTPTPIPKADPPVTPPSGMPPASNPTVSCVQAGDTVLPDAETLHQAYLGNCSGCHGTSGQGVGKIPGLRQSPTFEDFRAIVRAGKTGTAGTMPKFEVTHISDAELLALYATVTNQQLTAPADLKCTETRARTPAEVDAAINAGVGAWRKPDKDGAACASCHGMLPFDIAFIGYDDATIFRRALKHISEEDTRRVIDLVGALREKYGAPGARPFLDFRPFQPGGVVLPGASSAERDHAFGLNLATAAPTLGGGPITTFEQASKARDELLAINPRTFPIGIPLNRWTEDEFHGEEHRTINDWIPDLPRVPIDSAAEQALYAAHDAYLAAPSWDGVWAITDKLNELTTIKGIDPNSAGYGIFDRKYTSVLFAQHNFLLKLQGKPAFESLNAAPFPERNTIWSLGDHLRVFDGRDCDLAWTSCYSLPQESLLKINPNVPPEQEFARLRMSWFYVGWLFDTTLYHTGSSNATTSSEYFTRDLYGAAQLQESYLNHLTFIRFRKNLANAYENVGLGPGEKPPLSIDHPQAQNWGYFLEYQRGLVEGKMPEAGPKREVYALLLANHIRMMLLLLIEKIERTGQVYAKDRLLADVASETSSFGYFLSGWGGNWAQDQQLITRLRMAISSAVQIGQ